MTQALLLLLFIRPFISSLVFPYIDFTYLVLLMIFIPTWIISKGLHLKQSSAAVLPALAFLAALTISYITCGNKITAINEMSKYINGISIFFICASLSTEEKRQVLSTLLKAGIVISILAIYQYFFGFQHLIEYISKEKITDQFILDCVFQKRVFIPFWSPNLLGGYLAMILPLIFAYESPTNRILYIQNKNKFLLIILLFTALLLSKSIGALLSLLLGLLIYFFLQNKFKKIYFLSLLGLLISIIATILLRLGASQESFKPFFSIAMRLNYWQETWDIIKAHPLTGIGLGLGNFDLACSRFTHNTYLQLFAETGTLGIITFLWLITIIIKAGFKTAKENINNVKIAALLCSVLVFLLHNIIDFSFFLPEINLTWWAIMGLLFTNNNHIPKK